jgi:hypothetical protein
MEERAWGEEVPAIEQRRQRPHKNLKRSSAISFGERTVGAPRTGDEGRTFDLVGPARDAGEAETDFVADHPRFDDHAVDR